AEGAQHRARVAGAGRDGDQAVDVGLQIDVVPLPGIRLLGEDPVVGVDARLHEQVEGVVDQLLPDPELRGDPGEVHVAVRAVVLSEEELMEAAVAPGVEEVVEAGAARRRGPRSGVLPDREHDAHPRLYRPEPAAGREVSALDDPGPPGPEVLPRVLGAPGVEVADLAALDLDDAEDLAGAHPEAAPLRLGDHRALDL